MIKAAVLQLDQLDEIIKDTIIYDRRHKHYNRTVNLAKLYKQLITGEDQSELLVSYRPRESEAQKMQRVQLTNSATKHICEKIINQFKETDKVDNIVDEIIFKGNDAAAQKKTDEINERLSSFHQNESVKKYLDEAFRHLNFYDPNTWLIVELHPITQLNPRPFTYPVEIYSDQAINYYKENGILQWFIARQPKKIKVQPSDISNQNQTQNQKKPILKDGYKYMIYGPDYAIVYDELGNADEVPEDASVVRLKMEYSQQSDVSSQIQNIIQQQSLISSQSPKIPGQGIERTFAVTTYNTKSKINPAICVGYLPDAETNRETFVGILNPAEKILKDILRAKSEYDMANACHGFLQKFMYGQKCDDRACMDGRYKDQTTCTTCKGTGLKYHTSIQDVILISTPEMKEEHIPLSDFVHYVQIPETLIDRHKLDVQQYEKDVSKAIFNVNVFDRSEIAVTATEKKLDLRNIYNVFSPFGDRWSSVYKHIVLVTAIHLQMDEGLVIEHKFPSDFKLDSVDELLLQRKEAKDAGAPYDVIRYIDLQILSKQNVDNQEVVAMVDAMEYWKPFKSKSDQERSYALSQLSPDDDSKLLWMHWDRIWQMIDMDYIKDSSKPAFHKIPKDKQWEVLNGEIERIRQENQNQQSVVSSQTGLGGSIVSQKTESPKVGSQNQNQNQNQQLPVNATK